MDGFLFFVGCNSFFSFIKNSSRITTPSNNNSIEVNFTSITKKKPKNTNTHIHIHIHNA